MMNWSNTPFENLFSFVIGGDWGKDLNHDDPDFTEVYCIRGSEIRDWDNEKGRTAVLRKIASSSLEKRRLQEGDILVEISGGGPDQPVGRTVFIDKDCLLFEPKIPKVCTNFLRLVRLVDTVDKKYINYYLKYFYATGKVIEYQGGSNNLRNLKFPEYSKIEIPVAPISEQKLIVDKLDTLFANLDQLKARLEKIPTLLKQFRQAVLTQAVTGKLTEEWRGTKSLNGWVARKLQDLIQGIEAGRNFSCPETPVSGDHVGLVKISAVTWDRFDPKETKTVIDHDQINENYFIQEGDFLMSRANTIELVGASVIVDVIEHKIMISDKVWRVKFYHECTKKFVHRFLKSSLGRKEIESRATGNQLSMRNLSQENFRDIDLIVPPIAEQMEIVNRVDSLFNMIDHIEARSVKLQEKVKHLPQAILSKAFRGELVKGVADEIVNDSELLIAEVDSVLSKKKSLAKVNVSSR